MNTLLRHVAWMLCGLIATEAGSGCSDQQGTSPLQSVQSPDQTDMATSATEDMAIPGPTCQAAMGLAADKRLLCADFTTDGSPQIPGWDFAMGCKGAQWTIKDGALQLTPFDQFDSGSCDFQLPALMGDGWSPYSAFTIAILQNVGLRADAAVYQRAQVLLRPPPNNPTEPIVQFTGNQNPLGGMARPFRRATVTVNRSETSAGFRVQFNVQSSGIGTTGGGFVGWQIKSIAVLGHK